MRIAHLIEQQHRRGVGTGRADLIEGARRQGLAFEEQALMHGSWRQGGVDLWSCH